ncbi:NCK-interacting protein with SH3 domain isoform X5 [Ostrinia furnacalis]|uniref:NCK-interacting protein with SH3 domain isoform X1 n=1 Tax=Ostrinia furnacalis TaxID=93504 RepID=UPI00103A8D90|nr:NCK-interacting protein with SH3 domain isoform X1 [Ostrinia furnacalis]XP_028173440.1 NCK-interacting protein with SH3 domain isoform X2 [Ostrinia furnacalis]XP_028173441.1 NCK-interacting protein with SH3 domain isoform X3 [Ostrinia furnacalis]XP_028173442.1 NCK-interacting protein with SH3 domain isoform X4 [Ostrinia furnacalis]XP_028173443.1 NCK-interacting protein with SH3 domain isoform X5 [Ostrinia furnacalis]
MGDGQISPDECEMLKALYDFEATLTKTLSFSEGEFFFLQQNNAKQRNWWHVVNRKGQVGFVPSNYVASVKVDPEYFLAFVNDCIKSIGENSLSAQKQELVSRLNEKKKQLQMFVKPLSKKAQAPKPPPRLDDHTPPNGVSPSFDLRPVVSQQQISEERECQSPVKSVSSAKENAEVQHKNVPAKLATKQVSSDTDNQDDSQDSSEGNIKPNAIYEIVQAVRKETQLSHEMSKVAVETVLISLREFLPGGAARSIIDALLREANSNITCPKNAIDAAPDAMRMMTALNSLSKAANDAQQRGWALHDDAHDIQTQLLELISVMSNADMNISQHVLSSHRYAYVTTLVQYYQMETRWPLRQLLLQAFGVMCGLERTALATLALSALPAEIARDMRDNPRAVSRLSHSALLLSMVLSMGDKLPVTHFEQLGVEFAQFLLELIENPPETDENEQIPDLFLTLLLAYNLQFDQPYDSLLLNALETVDNAKTFCEKILLLLNREEDPVHIFEHEPAPPHSVLKLVIDLFSRKKTAEHFYTNDVKVAIDIIVRQLADLSAGDPRRQQYLKILQGIIRNTDYEAHLHRRQDLLRCFARIFCEEHEASREDQALVRAISNEFPQYFMA